VKPVGAVPAFAQPILMASRAKAVRYLDVSSSTY
jgi:hypothetical protein